MTNKHFLSATLSATFLSAALPAYAELTPQIALDRYFVLNETAGLNMTVGEKTDNGDSVRWSDIKIADDEGNSFTSIPWVEATQSSANTVLITTSPTAQTVLKAGDEDLSATINIVLENFETYVTEEDDMLNFSFSGEDIEFMTANDSSNSPLSLNASLSDVVGSYTMTGEKRVDGTVSTGNISFVYGVDDEFTQMSSKTGIDSMEATFGLDIVEAEEMEGFLTGDHSMEISYSFGESLTDVNFNGPEGQGSIVSGSGETSALLSMIDGKFNASGDAKDVTYKVMAPQLGLPPVDAAIAGIDLELGLEVGAAGEVTPMGIAFSLDQIEINEALWSLFDPNGEISREPATIRLDLGAESLWLSDDFEDAFESGEPPLMPQTLELRDLFISLGGASIVAEGAGEMSMATGQPSGSATVELRGLLELVQKLASIGIIPPQQAMMATAMVPQFTRPGPEGPEHLISDIEAGDDGSVWVNGNRIK